MAGDFGSLYLSRSRSVASATGDGGVKTLNDDDLHAGANEENVALWVLLRAQTAKLEGRAGASVSRRRLVRLPLVE